MTLKDTDTLQRLDAQSAKIADVFTQAGCELIAPDILQPADVFLERSGENIRQRAYVFQDMEGQELCLRPDLTVPACRVYLQRYPAEAPIVRYRYRGPAFRYEPVERPGVSPREFEQMGVEFFGDENKEKADAEILKLAIDALRASDLEHFAIRIGDLALFSAIADGIAMPARWRKRLKQHFWRPKTFHDVLRDLSADTVADQIEEHQKVLDVLDANHSATPIEALADLLERRGTPLTGARGLAEIAVRLHAQIADRTETPLSKEAVAAIGAFLEIEGSPRACVGDVAAIAKTLGIDISQALDSFNRRLDLAEEIGVDLSNAEFSAEFGRNLEYYTGFVFQLELPGSDRAGQIAGGGRYDNLLQDIGAPAPVPAIGCAIHTERLLAAAGDGAS